MRRSWKLPNVPAKGSLTAKMQEAAALDAQGFSVNEIADKVGVTRQTVSGWRHGSETYLDERARQVESIVQPLVKRLERERGEWLKLLPTVRMKLLDMMNAEIDGIPHYPTVAAAVKLIGESPVIRQLFKEPLEGDDKPRAIAAAAVTITIRDESKTIEGELVSEDG